MKTYTQSIAEGFGRLDFFIIDGDGESPGVPRKELREGEEVEFEVMPTHGAPLRCEVAVGEHVISIGFTPPSFAQPEPKPEPQKPAYLKRTYA